MNGASSIVHVITGLEGGGAERLLTNLITQQTSRDGGLTVVSLMPGGVFRPVLEAAGVEVVDLGVRRRYHGLRGLFRLAAVIRARKPAVVQGWMYHANVLSLMALVLAGRRRRTRLLWGIFASNLESSAYHWSSGVVRWLSRRLSGRVDGIIYNAREARDEHHAQGYREPRSVVIQNCVDGDLFRHEPALRQPVRDKLGINADTIMVVVVARVDPMKDWPGLLTAVRDLPGIVTVAIGKGTDQLPPQSGFVGLGWRNDVARILSGADIFLLASAFGEGTSLALEEAMSTGLPCVVTDVGGNAALVGDAGIVIPPRQPGMIREALTALAGDAARRGTIGRAARARAMAGGSADEIAFTLQQFTLSMEPNR